MNDGLAKALVAALMLVALVASYRLTSWIRDFALSRSLVDVPNSRSSHATPTPRGGGAAVVAVVLAALPLLAWHGMLPTSWLLAMSGAGLLVGGVGWIDDHGNVRARWRLLAHFSAAAWALAWLGGLPPLPVFGETIDLGSIGHGLAVLYLVWLLNLYNFMDGIDGIAGIEAVTVCFAALVLYLMAPVGKHAMVLPALLAVAVAGFLVWNFPRARIFMGDVGSGFVGIMVGILSLQAAAMAQELFWAWVILLGAFVVDATLTLLRRLMRGEAVYEAHRSHAYQHAARRVGSHAPVSLAFGAINVLWLLPVAALVVLDHLDGLLGVMVAYAPLVWLALRYDAGEADDLRLARTPDGGVSGG